MLARTEHEREREFRFTEQDFARVRTLLYQYAGISLNDSKVDLVYGRLSRRLRATGYTDFKSYLAFVTSAHGGAELVNFVNALTTNLTAFFREPHHFDYLQQRLLPESMRWHDCDRRIRYWSAGCSTGEEAYSIAMVVREHLPAARDWDLKILATDLDSSVVEAARGGRYTAQRIAGLSRQRAAKWFHAMGDRGSDEVQIDASLRELVTFKQLNLMQQWPMRGPFDAIFCRNVVIYFDKPTQQNLFDRYADLLVEGGYLFLGHSESMYQLCDRFELIGQTIYRKIR
jgi:chemotaxis protein methyltransferase CheR